MDAVQSSRAEFDLVANRLRHDFSRNLARLPIAQVALRCGLRRFIIQCFQHGGEFLDLFVNQGLAARGHQIGTGRDRYLELRFKVFFITFAAERYTHRRAIDSVFAEFQYGVGRSIIKTEW